MKNYVSILLLVLSFTLFSSWSNAGVKKFELTSDSINNLLNNEVRDTFSYSGLAASYNGLTAYTINGDIVKRLDDNIYSTLNTEQYLVVIGHYRILIAKNINANVLFKNNKLIWQKINKCRAMLIRNCRVLSTKNLGKLMPTLPIYVLPELLNY